MNNELNPEDYYAGVIANNIGHLIEEFHKLADKVDAFVETSNRQTLQMIRLSKFMLGTAILAILLAFLQVSCPPQAFRSGKEIHSAVVPDTSLHDWRNATSHGDSSREQMALDNSVKKFLNIHAGEWHDLNVSSVDGQFLHDLIIKNKYTKALEIGTSSGHSGVWIAWALSKTGGKLITIESNRERHKEALANFREAGLADYIDARLADAHNLVKKLDGPFDFVLSSADEKWQKQYFVEIAPRLLVGGCFAVRKSSGRYDGIQEYAKYVTSLNNFESTFNSSGTRVAISYKKTQR